MQFNAIYSNMYIKQSSLLSFYTEFKRLTILLLTFELYYAKLILKKKTKANLLKSKDAKPQGLKIFFL